MEAVTWRAGDRADAPPLSLSHTFAWRSGRVGAADTERRQERAAMGDVITRIWTDMGVCISCSKSGVMPFVRCL